MKTTVTAFALVVFAFGMSCTAGAGSIPTDITGTQADPFALSASSQTDWSDDGTLIASLAPSASFDFTSVTSDKGTPSKSSRSKWIAYAASTAGLVAGLAPSLSRGANALVALSGGPTDREPTPSQEQPIPEPTTLALAVLACSTGLIPLLRRRSTI